MIKRIPWIAICLYTHPLQRFPIATAVTLSSFKGILFVFGEAAHDNHLDRLKQLLGIRVKIISVDSLFAQEIVNKLNTRIARFFIKLVNFRLFFFKAVPYHMPPVHSSAFNVVYFGDGLGVFPLSGHLPWYPQPTIPYDTPFMEGKYKTTASFIYGSESSDSNAGWKLCRNSINSTRSFLCSEIVSSQSSAVFQAAVNSSHAVFLSTLGEYRSSAVNELALYEDYARKLCLYPQRPLILVFLHPKHLGDDAYKTRIKHAFENGVKSRGGSVIIVGLDRRYQFLENLTSEAFATILCRGDGRHDLPTIHTFQTSHLFLATMYPQLTLSFGYGEDLVKKYFYPESIPLQLNFEYSLLMFKPRSTPPSSL